MQLIAYCTWHIKQRQTKLIVPTGYWYTHSPVYIIIPTDTILFLSVSHFAEYSSQLRIVNVSILRFATSLFRTDTNATAYDVFV